MKTHYLISPKASACGLHKPRRATKRSEAVDCPSCRAWIDKNLEIRKKQIQDKSRIPAGPDMPNFHCKPDEGSSL